MGLNSKERFENHMDIASPEMVGDRIKLLNTVKCF